MTGGWRKEGLVYKCDIFGTDYAQIPFIDPVSDTVWRIYYSTRTRDVVSYPFSLDVAAGDPKNILKVHDRPLLELGERGAFDDSGLTVSSIVNVGGRKYLYYIGWNQRVSVSYALNIGLAVSEDGGSTFKKMFRGPVVDRSRFDPIFATAPCVVREEGLFRMWYVSCLRWDVIDDRTEPVYIIKHAVSPDGMDWEINDKICLDSAYEGEALGRPWVVREGGVYKMWFSARGSRGYRLGEGQHYMLAYAESADGLNWERRPDKFSLPLSPEGWDSEMMEYCSVHVHSGKKYMLYNGNSFGRTGFGLAVEE